MLDPRPRVRGAAIASVVAAAAHATMHEFSVTGPPRTVRPAPGRLHNMRRVWARTYGDDLSIESATSAMESP